MYSEQDLFDKSMMQVALERAADSAAIGEVPVGAVLVDLNRRIISSSGNNVIQANDPAGHAEIRVLRHAASELNNYRLPGTTLYVTLEPCAMCGAAMVHSRIDRLVFGAFDPKTGAVVSKYSIGRDGQLNHTFKVTGGILEQECGKILRDFFRKRR